ncbi:MAG TPA: hypothetical protein VIS96_06885 [Terrimicrobiaceae bacterium]
MTKEEILAELTSSRAAVVKGCADLRAELDLKTKINDLVRRKPYAWLSGATALGWFFAGPKTRTRVVTKSVESNGPPVVKVEKKKRRFGLIALLIGLIRFAIPVIKPAFAVYAGRRFADMVKKRLK